MFKELAHRYEGTLCGIYIKGPSVVIEYKEINVTIHKTVLLVSPFPGNCIPQNNFLSTFKGAHPLVTIGENLSLDEDIQKWTVNDVHNFIRGLPGCSDYAQVTEHLSTFIKIRHFEICFLQHGFCQTCIFLSEKFASLSLLLIYPLYVID